MSNGTVYRDTWEPVSIDHASGVEPLIARALHVQEPAEIGALFAAGGQLIGHHTTTKGWATRAASTGGTHFVPVSATASAVRTQCVSGSSTLPLVCASHERPGRWTRIAVIRVPAGSWHLLPPHLIPPASVVMPGVTASAVREGCSVHRYLGATKCSSDWNVRVDSIAILDQRDAAHETGAVSARAEP